MAAGTKTNGTISLPNPATGAQINTATLDKTGYVIRPPAASGFVTNVNGRITYAASSITGDLDVRVKLAPTSWANGGNQIIAGKSTTADPRGWILSLSSAGIPTLNWSVTGINASSWLSRSPGVVTGFAAGSTGWVRVVLDVDNGSSGHTVTFYTSNDGLSWTTLGSPIVETVALNANSQAVFDPQVFAATTLVPGTYTLTAETTGFKKTERPGIEVRVNDKLSVDLQLELGSTSESVEVTAAPPLLESTNASKASAAWRVRPVWARQTARSNASSELAAVLDFNRSRSARASLRPLPRHRPGVPCGCGSDPLARQRTG